MLPPRYLKQVDWKEFALKPVGTGPYRFVEWIKDDRVVLEANPDYWRGAPRVKRVVWRPIPDNFARVAALVRGEAQLITKVIPDHVPEIEKAGCCRVEHTLTNLVTVYLINAQKGPLANAKVRQALNYAVDKDKIIKELSSTRGTRSRSAAASPTPTSGTTRRSSRTPTIRRARGSSSRRPGTRAASTSTSRAGTAST
jgi:peptide/nickel transport system substrate-binding protein